MRKQDNILLASTLIQERVDDYTRKQEQNIQEGMMFISVCEYIRTELLRINLKQLHDVLIFCVCV